jgi:hypothetical protein
MTLILTRASQKYVLQVTDRLVTEKKSRKPFEEVANKNILYCARNGIATIGYTGHAIIGGVTTDQWIVEKMTGVSFSRNRKLPAIRNVTFPWIDIGQCLRILKEKLDNAQEDIHPSLKKDWIASTFDVSVAGWQWDKKGRSKPFMASCSKPENSGSFELTYIPRTDLTRGKFNLCAAPAVNISKSRLRKLKDDISSRSIDETERLMVETIREISTQVPEVGPNCMSIFISPPSVGRVRTRYVPVTSTNAIAATETGELHLTVAFSPWVIGQNVIVAPSLISGHGISVPLGQCPYNIDLEAPVNPQIKAILSSQQRRTR